MKVTVLGAGIIGISTAWYLSEEGHEVTVVDRQPDAALETSFANGAQISVSFCEPWANAGAPLKVLKWLGQGYYLRGTLELRGISQPVVFEVEPGGSCALDVPKAGDEGEPTPRGGECAVEARGSIQRSLFGMSSRRAVSDRVSLRLRTRPFAVMSDLSALISGSYKAARKMSFSTFSGCGGSSTGYRMAGFKMRWASEFIPAAQDSYRANMAPYTVLDTRDIRQVQPEDILRAAGLDKGEIDLFDGSPPCQGFSTSGDREVGDQRNQLFREFVRLLSGLRPRAFVMENVSGMVKGDFKVIFAEILRTLKACGYRVKVRLLNAMFYGVPQSRERMIFVGVRDDLAADPSHPAGWCEPISLLSVLSGLSGLSGLSMVREGFGPTKLDRVRNEEFANNWRSAALPCCTIVKSRPPILGFTAGPQREMAPHECQRIGSFPDPFKFIGGPSKAVERIGNSVPPLLMRSIARHVRTLIAR